MNVPFEVAATSFTIPNEAVIEVHLKIKIYLLKNYETRNRKDHLKVCNKKEKKSLQTQIQICLGIAVIP